MFVAIDRNENISIKKQLYDGLSEKILNGVIPSGEKLPSSRQLSEILNIARNTVIEVYEQLVAEGYLLTEKGTGTFVQEIMPIQSQNSERLLYTRQNKVESKLDFIIGRPDSSLFPKSQWAKLAKEVVLDMDKNSLGYKHPFGYQSLRKSIANYLATYKGIDVSYQQVIITSGTTDSLALIALLFREKGKISTESPVVDFVPDIFRQYGYDVNGVAMDQHGIVVEELCLAPELIFISPSHQSPLGMTMPIDRRLQLLKYAVKEKAYVIEDDYDSEFRYKGAMVNSLFQLAPSNVIHLGTFSKTLAPALRMGYMVLPTNLCPLMREMIIKLNHRTDVTKQMALDAFISSGKYVKHVSKSCKVYKKKMEKVIHLTQSLFTTEVEIFGGNSGLHIYLQFADKVFDTNTVEQLRQQGYQFELVDEYELNPKGTDNRLLIGFGHLTLQEIETGFRQLKKLIDNHFQ